MTFTVPSGTALQWIWLSGILYSFRSGPTATRSVKRESSTSRLRTLLVVIPAAVLLSYTGLRFGILQRRFVPDSAALRAAGFLITFAGLGVTLWARHHLGKFWSARVALKQDHELIRSGPYAYVRHPIYSGLFIALIGTALVIGEWRALLAVLP